MIHLKLEHSSVSSKSIYYVIMDGNKSVGLLRVSDHPKEDWRGFYYHCSNPKEVEEEELVEWLIPILTKMRIRDQIGNIRIKNS